MKLTRAPAEAGSGEAASELWSWLQHNESVTVHAKQSGSVLVALARVLAIDKSVDLCYFSNTAFDVAGPQGVGLIIQLAACLSG